MHAQHAASGAKTRPAQNSRFNDTMGGGYAGAHPGNSIRVDSGSQQLLDHLTVFVLCCDVKQRCCCVVKEWCRYTCQWKCTAIHVHICTLGNPSFDVINILKLNCKSQREPAAMFSQQIPACFVSCAAYVERSAASLHPNSNCHGDKTSNGHTRHGTLGEATRRLIHCVWVGTSTQQHLNDLIVPLTNCIMHCTVFDLVRKGSVTPIVTRHKNTNRGV